MKSIYYIIIIAIVIILTGNSCKKGGRCEEPEDVNQSSIVVAFKDNTTGRYLYSEVNPLYNKDSLKVFDPSGNSLVIRSALNQIPNTSSRYFDVSFGNIYDQQTDGAAFSSEVCKTFLVKYRFNETDSIKACFTAKKTKCGSVFENLKVYYKGMLVGSVTNTAGVVVIINK